jgi:hypothetical protein
MLFILIVTYVFALDINLAAADRFLQRGMFVYAIQEVDKVIDEGKGDEDAYALRGFLMGVRGRYDSALNDYDYGLASDRLWHREGEGFATTMRIVGECEKAIEHRVSLLQVGKLPYGAHLRVMYDLVDDYRYCGRFADAWRIQEVLESQFPRASMTHMAAADLYLDEGDIDSAYFELWLSRLYFTHISSNRIESRIALIEERYQEAFLKTRYIQTNRVPDRDLIIQLLANYLSNDSSAVIHQTNQFRWKYNENPVIVFIRMLAFQELKEHQKLEEEKFWFDTICTDDCPNFVRTIIALELGRSYP